MHMHIILSTKKNTLGGGGIINHIILVAVARWGSSFIIKYVSELGYIMITSLFLADLAAA